MTAEQVYNDSIKPMPEIERLRLAAIIINDLATRQDYSEEWTEQDMRDATNASLRRFEEEHARGET